MDKPMESKRTVSSTDLKPVERFLKRYDTLTSRDSSSRRPDAREQIIEEQIEEYKKKREKVLGNQSAKTCTVNEMQKEVQEEKIWATLSPKKAEKEIIVSIKEKEEEEEEEKEKKEETEEGEKVTESQEKVNDSTKEYISKLSREKLKWEEAKQKKENVHTQESDETHAEGNLEKLTRILGEKEENLQVISV